MLCRDCTATIGSFVLSMCLRDHHSLTSLVSSHAQYSRMLRFLTLFSSQVIVLFYLHLFRTTISVAFDQTRRVRKFVDMLPVHVLTKEETGDVINFFKSE